MRSSGLILAGVLAVAGTGLLAQAPPVHAPDGGTMERIQSIDIPPLPNAPFTATVITEWTQILGLILMTKRLMEIGSKT